jgi:hypothetical protein
MESLSPQWTESVREGFRPYQRGPSHRHGDYACSLGRVVMSDDDGIDSSTRAPVAKCAWTHVAMSSRVRH